MLRDTLIAALRTGVAGAVGLAITWVVGLGITIPDGFSESLNVVMFGVVVAVYNVLVSLGERNVHPMIGWLLGFPKAPAYGAAGTQTPPPDEGLLTGDDIPVDRG